MSDNDQQDVSEFMHIVLEWVEEAFKEPEAFASSLTSKSVAPEMMDEGSNDQVIHRLINEVMAKIGLHLVLDVNIFIYFGFVVLSYSNICFP
jgi:hypothetical protein